MRDAEQLLLRIPGVTEAQVFAKVLVRCEFPMSPDTMAALQLAQAQIEYKTGWKIEMTISGPRWMRDLLGQKYAMTWETEPLPKRAMRPPRKLPRTPDSLRGI